MIPFLVFHHRGEARRLSASTQMSIGHRVYPRHPRPRRHAAPRVTKDHSRARRSAREAVGGEDKRPFSELLNLPQNFFRL